MKATLDALRSNRSGLFDDLVTNPRFEAFYEDTSRANAELRERLNRELPSLINATTGL